MLLQVEEGTTELCLNVKIVKSCSRDLDSNVTSPMKEILENVKMKVAKKFLSLNDKNVCKKQ